MNRLIATRLNRLTLPRVRTARLYPLVAGPVTPSRNHNAANRERRAIMISPNNSGNMNQHDKP